LTHYDTVFFSFAVPIKDILKFVHQFAGKPGMEAMVVPSVFQIFEIALKDILKCAALVIQSAHS
jgi:hypothetical protein